VQVIARGSDRVFDGAYKLLYAVRHIELYHGAIHRVKWMWNIQAR
jgi:hypothetical protein